MSVSTLKGHMHKHLFKTMEEIGVQSGYMTLNCITITAICTCTRQGMGVVLFYYTVQKRQGLFKFSSYY